jgi:hypothetical protein
MRTKETHIMIPIDIIGVGAFLSANCGDGRLTVETAAESVPETIGNEASVLLLRAIKKVYVTTTA